MIFLISYLLWFQPCLRSEIRSWILQPEKEKKKHLAIQPSVILMSSVLSVQVQITYERQVHIIVIMKCILCIYTVVRVDALEASGLLKQPVVGRRFFLFFFQGTDNWFITSLYPSQPWCRHPSSLLSLLLQACTSSNMIWEQMKQPALLLLLLLQMETEPGCLRRLCWKWFSFSPSSLSLSSFSGFRRFSHNLGRQPAEPGSQAGGGGRREVTGNMKGHNADD